MQVISGNHRGLKLNTPETDHTRPTLSRVKEAVFSSIAETLPHSVFLDLFAGTGQIGIEALSRGAANCVFVDNDPQAMALIKANVAKLKGDNYTLIHQEAEAALATLSCDFDLIYIDPPYTYGKVETLLSAILAGNKLKDDGLIILEQSITEPLILPTGLTLYKTKKYGKTNIYYMITASLDA